MTTRTEDTEKEREHVRRAGGSIAVYPQQRSMLGDNDRYVGLACKVQVTRRKFLSFKAEKLFRIMIYSVGIWHNGMLVLESKVMTDL